MKWVVSIAGIIAVLDQLTKTVVAGSIGVNEQWVIVPGLFNLVHWRNTGAAWGILQDYNLALAAISLLTILALYLFRHTFQLDRPLARVALGLIAGGIIGNLVDRVRLHCVIDFLDFYFGRNHWPAFNIADSAICIGVVLYIIVSWQTDHDHPADQHTEMAGQ